MRRRHAAVAGRRAEIARATGWIVALVALVVAVPLVLWRLVGNPLPSGLPSGAEFRDAITNGNISDTTLIKVIGVLSWLLWAQLIIAVVVEAAAARRARPAQHRAFLGPTQIVAGRMVAAAIFVAGVFTSRPAASTATALPPPAPQVALAHTGEDVATNQPTPAAPSPQPPPSTAAPDPSAPTVNYTVQRLDSLWGIAERTLGDGQRWRDIEALNLGRPQSDGGALEPGGVIRPGWVLLLPSDALTGGPAPDPTRAVTVQPGDTLWDLAATHLGDPAKWPQLWELNAGHPQPDGSSLEDPNQIDPGWELELAPAPPAPAATPPSPTPAPAPPQASPRPPPISAPPPTSSPRASPSRGGDRPAHHDGNNHDVLGAPSRLPLGIATSAVLAFGALGVLRVLRHRQQKRRRPGRDLPRPTPAQAETEVALRTAAADQPAEWLDAALRTLARTRPRRREPTPSPVALRVGPDELTVTLAEPVPTPPPMWTTTPPGWVWHLDRNVPLARLHDATRGLCAPMPATTTVGHDAAGPLMLDLEACGLVTITGPVDEARGLARSSVLELSTSPLADVLDIVVVQTPGRPPLVPPTPANERVRVLESPHAALTFVAQQAAATAHSLQDAGLPSTFAARTSAAGADPWPPAVVVLDDVPGADERAEFEALTLPGGRGLAVLAVGDWPGAPWTLDVGDSLLDVSRLGLFGLRASIHAQTINEDTASNVADLLGQTLQDSDDPLVAPAAPSVDTDEDEAPGATPATDPGDSPTVIEPPTPSRIEPAAHEIQVRVLGDVDVVGSTRPLQPGEVELVAFLATREHPVEPDVAQTALWPHREPSPKRWWNVLSSTRQALGCAQDGQFHFPLTQRRERLALAPTVGCDLNELRELLRTMEGQDRAASIAALEEGLRFVRGRPFSARRGYDWAHANGTVAHAEAVVSDAAHALASLQLEVGEAKGALEATAMGLLAAPANEILYRDRMLAHHLAGNTAGVEAALRDLCVALEVEDPCDELHPDTLTLYEELTHRRPTDRTSRSVGG